MRDAAKLADKRSFWRRRIERHCQTYWCPGDDAEAGYVVLRASTILMTRGRRMFYVLGGIGGAYTLLTLARCHASNDSLATLDRKWFVWAPLWQPSRKEQGGAAPEAVPQK